MAIRSSSDVTAAVLEAVQGTEDPRLREIFTALVTHLHGFVRDVRLTEPEFRAAVEVVNRIGQLTNDRHNEAMLMSGSLGVSALVCLLNNGNDGEFETTQNMLGPFWRKGAPMMENGASILRDATPGAPMFVDLAFTDRDGAPVEGLEVHVWHCSSQGFYENQQDQQADMNFRGRFMTGPDGRIWFRSLRQSGYPVPTDGVVGAMLAAQGRHPNRPAHLHVLAHKAGFKTLISQIYDATDPYIDDDAQFGVTAALIGSYERHDDPREDAPAPWFSLKHRLVMEPGISELPAAPIR